jgi:hypothetical protein
MPLVPARAERGETAGDERREEARKIRPRYARGELVRVAVGRNQAEAELIKGMLLEQGIPSVLRRTIGFDVPDFLAAGPRDVLVPAGGAEAARELLAGAEGAAEPAGDELPAGPSRSAAVRLVAALLVALLLFAALAGALFLLVR